MESKLVSVLVVSKHDNSKCASIKVSSTLPALGPSSVRVQTKLITAASNNLSYARNGALLHWWDTYPVPSNAPEPFNSANDWGIVPAWGFGEIIESKIESLKIGSQLWGFWPMSCLPLDLKLVPSAPTGHWREISEHRKQLMSIYQRYNEVEESLKSASDETRGWTTALYPVFAAALVLNRYVFPGALDAPPLKAQHPLGLGHPWGEDDGDLRSSVLVSLSAATKTARAFASQILRNRDITNHGPLGFLQLTRNAQALDASAGFPSRVVNYHNAGDADILQWIASLKPERIVMINFGAPAGTVARFMNSIKQSDVSQQQPSLTFIGVGSEMRILSDRETKQQQADGLNMGRIQFNTSTVRDRGIEIEGPQTFFEVQDRAFAKWMTGSALGDLKLSWGDGVDGPGGLASVWEALCTGRLAPEKACVFRL